MTTQPNQTSQHTFTEIRCQNIRKSYESQPVLSNVTLSFQSGTISSILGANGAGKSTLIGILAGSILPASGKVLCVTKEKKEFLLDRRYVGLIAHQTMIYGDLSARENLRFYARLYGCSSEMVEIVIKRCGLSTYADRRASTYSRGMAQRTSIARALLHRPKVLLCDEPYSGLDPAGNEILSQILQESRDEGTIIILVTHDIEVASNISDRAVILHRGKVKADLSSPLNAKQLRENVAGKPLSQATSEPQEEAT